MRISWINAAAILASFLAAALLAAKNIEGPAAHHLLNASYDPTRELYAALNPRFVAKYQAESGSSVAIRQSHGGSSQQAKRVANGEEHADVVTLGLPSDVEAIQNRGLISAGWRERLPNHSRPYYSTVVFVVRKGNPHGVRDWPDLVRPGIEVITPDPKTSGNGKLTALAAWGAVTGRGGGDEEARQYLRALYDHAPFLTPASRAAGVAFAIEKKGDVHIAWENEALREVAESKGALQIVYPPLSILAEPSVAWVDANVAKRGAAKLAQAYLEYLFTDDAQEVVARAGYRPFSVEVLKRHADRFPEMELFPITNIARDWTEAQRKFFGENGIIDAVYSPKPRVE